jgi:hypothetical protein
LDYFKLKAGKQLDVVRAELNLRVRLWNRVLHHVHVASVHSLPAWLAVSLP